MSQMVGFGSLKSASMAPAPAACRRRSEAPVADRSMHHEIDVTPHVTVACCQLMQGTASGFHTRGSAEPALQSCSAAETHSR